jgi:predicted phage terminase large subunit-like protein
VDTHFPGHHAHPILVERAANGAAIIETLRAEIPSIRPIIPDGDKVSRVYAIAGQIENGYVHLPGMPNHDGTGYDSTHTPEWVAAFIEEAAAFPHGRHDDQVDAMTQALRNAPSHAYRTSVNGPATTPGLARLPNSVAAMMQTQRSILDNPAFRASLEHPRPWPS